MRAFWHSSNQSRPHSDYLRPSLLQFHVLHEYYRRAANPQQIWGAVSEDSIHGELWPINRELGEKLIFANSSWIDKPPWSREGCLSVSWAWKAACSYFVAQLILIYPFANSDPKLRAHVFISRYLDPLPLLCGASITWGRWSSISGQKAWFILAWLVQWWTSKTIQLAFWP